MLVIGGVVDASGVYVGVWYVVCGVCVWLVCGYVTVGDVCVVWVCMLVFVLDVWL